MKNTYLILFFSIVVLFLIFLAYNEITGKVVRDDEKDLSCFYRQKFGTNELNSEDCCRRIKGFYQCEDFLEESSIFVDGNKNFVDGYCFNNKGDLALFYTKDVRKFCEDEGFL